MRKLLGVLLFLIVDLRVPWDKLKPLIERYESNIGLIVGAVCLAGVVGVYAQLFFQGLMSIRQPVPEPVQSTPSAAA